MKEFISWFYASVVVELRKLWKKVKKLIKKEKALSSKLQDIEDWILHRGEGEVETIIDRMNSLDTTMMETYMKLDDLIRVFCLTTFGMNLDDYQKIETLSNELCTTIDYIDQCHLVEVSTTGRNSLIMRFEDSVGYRLLITYTNHKGQGEKIFAVTDYGHEITYGQVDYWSAKCKDIISVLNNNNRKKVVYYPEKTRVMERPDPDKFNKLVAGQITDAEAVEFIGMEKEEE